MKDPHAGQPLFSMGPPLAESRRVAILVHGRSASPRNIGPPGTAWSETGPFDGMPVFVGCSDVDAHVPKSRVEESVEVFARQGAEVPARIYPGMGHVVCDDEIERARALIDRV